MKALFSFWQKLSGEVHFQRQQVDPRFLRDASGQTAPGGNGQSLPAASIPELKGPRVDKFRKMLQLGLGAAMDGYVDCVRQAPFSTTIHLRICTCIHAVVAMYSHAHTELAACATRGGACCFGFRKHSWLDRHG